jgi:hypothetical protein
MMPECIRGELSMKVDIFAFGFVVLETLTGSAVYEERFLFSTHTPRTHRCLCLEGEGTLLVLGLFLSLLFKLLVFRPTFLTSQPLSFCLAPSIAHFAIFQASFAIPPQLFVPVPPLISFFYYL